ncbi:MAG: hypothetical protein ACUVQ8_02465 [Nitrososphaeria archaeon]
METLETAKSLSEIFSIIKMVVNERLGLHRAGLTLVIMDLPPNVLAQYQMGSNMIVMDGKALDALDHALVDRVERNSYAFVVLLHKYLHSLGIVSEEKVRRLVLNVVEHAFPGNPIIRRVALNPTDLIGNGQFTLKPSRRTPSLVRDFDRESMPYIG